MPKPIDITDEFLDPAGEWTNYDAIPFNQEEALREQKHVDIRSFVPDLPSARVTMLLTDRLTMFDLDGKEIATLSSGTFPPARVIVVNNEEWTFGTVGPQTDRNNWNGISVECDPAISSITTTQSVIRQNG